MLNNQAARDAYIAKLWAKVGAGTELANVLNEARNCLLMKEYSDLYKQDVIIQATKALSKWEELR